MPQNPNLDHLQTVRSAFRPGRRDGAFHRRDPFAPRPVLGLYPENGHDRTADEALADEGEVAVTLSGGKRISATIAGRDPTTDIALLRADIDAVSPIALDGSAPSAGALAVVVGGREEKRWRLRGRDVRRRLALDARRRDRADRARPPQRPHAEGGLALDASGQAFGMAVFGPRRRVLVVPAATIARVAAQIEAHGKVARGYLGLGLQPVRLDRDGGVGAMVMSVAEMAAPRPASVRATSSRPGMASRSGLSTRSDARSGPRVSAKPSHCRSDAVVKRARSFSRSAKGPQTLSDRHIADRSHRCRARDR